jgi:hypothetical protein
VTDGSGRLITRMLAVIGVLSALPAAAAAQAATVSASAPNIVYTSAPAQVDRVTVTTGSTSYDFTRGAGSTGTITAGSGCFGSDPVVSCSGFAGATITFNLDDGDDKAGGGPTLEGSGSPARFVLNGGAGADDLRGTSLSDQLDGGSGADTMTALGGDDTVAARDGTKDTIDCGDGAADLAIVDAIDTIVGCETVNYPDADGDGATANADCDDANAAIHPGATDVPGNGIDEDCSGADAPVQPAVDRDGDSVLPPLDCDDGNPAIRPGATDVPGNGVDEDCSGTDAAARTVGGRISSKFAVRGSSSRVKRLKLTGLPAGARVAVKCTGKGCPPGTTTLTAHGGAVNVTLLLRGHALRAGAKLRLRITAAGRTGRQITFTMRKGRQPRRLIKAI